MKRLLTAAVALALGSCSPARAGSPPAQWTDAEQARYLGPLQANIRTTAGSATGTRGAVTVAYNAYAARAGLDILHRGGNSIDAALTTALTQVATTAGAPVSYFGIMSLVHYDAKSSKISTLWAGWRTVLGENSPLTIPGAVTLNGLAGDDKLFGGNGSDSLDGSDGKDSLDGGAGNDMLSGGIGNDTLTGGSGVDVLDGGADNDILDGQADDDILNGGTGRDLLIGGLGADTLSGGDGDDIVLSGTTSHSSTIAALNAILAEWTSAKLYATRVTNLQQGGGLNGSTKLNRTTIQNDSSAADQLTGSSETDWFFQSAGDILVDFNAGIGELKTAI